MKRTLYVDGSNLYHGMTDLLPAGQFFEFKALLQAIDKELSIDKVKFYASYMKIDPAKPVSSQLQAKAQVEFLNSAKQIKKLEFSKGYYNTFGKEKGVDVRIAVDIVRDGYENDYDEAVIMSGDDDFLYAVDIAKILKPIHMAAFGPRYGYSMAHKTARRIVFDYGRHFQDRVLPTLRKPPKNLEIIDLTPHIKPKTV